MTTSWPGSTVASSTLSTPFRPPATLTHWDPGVVPVARDRADVRRGGLAQHAMALEGQVAVGVVPVNGGAGDLPGDSGRRDVGVEVLQPQEAGIAGRVGGVAHLVHADPRNVP